MAKRVPSLNSSSLTSVLSNITPWRFEIFVNKDWGSDKQNNRLSVREEIKKHYLFKNEALDLNLLPEPMTGSLSISHCQNLGGFAFCDRRSVGFDIECISRITKPIVDRISLDSEKSQNFSPYLLWPAKEAAFKAARPLQVKVLKDIEILAISEIADSTFRFKGLVTNTNQLLDGLITADSEFTMAIAWLKQLEIK